MIEQIKPYLALIRIAAVAALAVLVWMHGERTGSNRTQLKWDAAIADQAKRSAKIQLKQSGATVRVVTQYVDRVRTVRVAGETVIRKVPIYVTREADRRCPVPAGFVRMWNAANSGIDPGAPGDSDAATSPVVLSDVATQHAREAEQCRETEEQLIGLQYWIKVQYKVTQ